MVRPERQREPEDEDETLDPGLLRFIQALARAHAAEDYAAALKESEAKAA